MPKTQKRRRIENKTDYLKRFKMLKSGMPRVVFRKTNKYILAQYVTSTSAQDKVEINLTSKNLLNYGWPEKFSGSLKSIPASYLTGLLMGKTISSKKLQTPIVDFGMIRMLHKSKTYAFLNGLIDSGIKIQCDKKFFPEENRIKGKNLKEDFSKTFETIKLKIIGSEEIKTAKVKK